MSPRRTPTKTSKATAPAAPVQPMQTSLLGDDVAVAPTARRAAATQDVELVASVIRAAIEPGYMVVGPAEKPYRIEPGTKNPTVLHTVPRHEADTVSQLIDSRHLTIGGHHTVLVGRKDGPGRSVLVPSASRAMVSRWGHYKPLSTQTGDARPARSMWCPECGEPAQQRPPTSWTAANGRRPEYSHLDGEPLCPVVTAQGYRPARPTTRKPGSA